MADVRLGPAGHDRIKVQNNPVNAIDPWGLDLFYENTSSVHGLHQRVSVGSDSTRDYGISYSRTGNGDDSFISASGDNPGIGKEGLGIVYEDYKKKSTKVVEQYITTPEEDKWLIEQMKNEVNKTGKYHWLVNNCRTYSKMEYLKLVEMINKKRTRKDGCH